MEFSEDEINDFLEEHDEHVLPIYDNYKDLCLKYEVIPVSLYMFSSAIMTVIKRTPSMSERAEFYRDRDIESGIISEEDALPPTLFYELHLTKSGGIFLSASFMDEGVAIAVLEIPKDDLEDSVFQKSQVKEKENG